MSSEAITRNDLTAILNEVLPPTPSEYRKLLWANPNPTSSFAAQTVSLDLSDYDEVEVICKPYSTDTAYFASRVEVGNKGMLYSQTGYGSPVRIYGTQRNFTPTSTGVAFGDGLDFSASVSNAYCVPYQIYGIKYDYVAPPQAEIADVVVEQGTSGIWTYRKWASGIAECWGNYSGSVTLSTVATYYHRGSLNNISYPTSLFNSAPTVNVTNQTSTYWCAVESNSSTEITRIHIYDVVNGTSTVKVGLYVVGTWK